MKRGNPPNILGKYLERNFLLVDGMKNNENLTNTFKTGVLQCDSMIGEKYSRR
jgi:hypothetical protein